MALFNRNNRTNVPAEIQEYYQTERRERAGIAWLLAFGTILVTIALAAGIFFAGRWAYRKIAGNDTQNNSSQQQASQDQGQQNQNTPPKSAEQLEQERLAREDQAREQEAAQKAEADRKAAEEARKAEEQKQAQAAQQRAAEQQRQQAAANQNTSGRGAEQVAGANDAITNTGPGDTLAIFFAVSVLGYLAHRVYQVKLHK
jgi:cytoskeletal protein RodZ